MQPKVRLEEAIQNPTKSMYQLIKHSLEFELPYLFFKDSLEDANTLSNELLNLLNFKDGSFFTLLPEDANLERIYELETGLVLPQYPEIPNETGKGSYQYIPNIEDEISDFIYQKLSLYNEYTCVLDDVIRYSSDSRLELFILNKIILSL